ncbi:MAG TPA: serine/threonine-protein kinase [Kofleriaceae bacterium]|nr:serine/threonine-protein kinase [Kofleriaceae bacterium]
MIRLHWTISELDDTEAGEGTSATIVDAPRRAPRRDAAELAAGMRLEHFQILEPLGRGGMGSVYSAYDLRLDRKVAIKILAQAGRGAELEHRRQRLLREAQMMAKLSHPNVVPVYEVGVDRDTLFIAMEYVAGRTLGRWLADDKPSWRQIIDAFAQAGRGLAAAHEADIVHRDFKPANVLLDAQGRVRVVDFGVAQARGPAEVVEQAPPPRPRIELGDGSEVTPPTPQTPLTEAGSLVGTPAYMSPEQFRTNIVDARSDQFSFCVALFEALFGKRPFAGTGKELAERVTKGELDRPDPKSPVPGWVIAIVLRGLSTDPDRRFPSMTALVDALARDPTRRRRRLAAIAAGTLVLAGTVALVGWRLYARGAIEPCAPSDAAFAGVWDPPAHAALERAFVATGAPYARSAAARVEALFDRYRGDWLAMRGDACRATRVRGEQSEHVLDLRDSCLDHRLGELRALSSLLAGAVDAKAVERSVDAASALAPIAACADTDALLAPGSEPIDPGARARRAALRDRLDRLRAEAHTGRAKAALPAARALVTDARAAGDAVMVADALELQGATETASGDLAAAQATLGEALRRARQLGDVNRFAATTIDLVDALAEASISGSREALGVVRVGEAVIDDTSDPVLPFRLAYEKADLYLTLAHADTALAILGPTTERARRALGPEHVQVFDLEALYASALARTGKQDEARARYDKLVADTGRVLGPMHPLTMKMRLDRCHTYFEADDLPNTVTCYAAALPDARRALDAHDRELLYFVSDYAFGLLHTGRTREAREVLARAYADVPDAAWTDKWFIAAEIARMLGEVEVEAGDYAAALAHCQRGEDATEAQHRGPVGATCIGEAQLGLGEPARALAALEPLRGAIDTGDATQLGASPEQVAAWRFAYARAVWGARHDAALARSLATKARGELSPGAQRDQLDAWLAHVH